MAKLTDPSDPKINAIGTWIVIAMVLITLFALMVKFIMWLFGL